MPNRLIHESSPYLLQHAHNPVDWYPWGPEALELARRDDRPIFLSIGYSACHWCHVMERESFEDESIAELMNRYFVNVKVDREERPDLDKIYMQAVQLLTGHGGWPMSVWLTPQLEPFYGGTYFPPQPQPGMPSFPQLVRTLGEAWTERRGDVLGSAGELAQVLHGLGRLPESPGGLSEAVLRRAVAELNERFDARNGGFGRAPKFPNSFSLAFLLRAWKRFGQAEPRSMVELALRKMGRGGIYDQLGGGFHRYSVDAHWLVPHFEKMLYDNALLSNLFIEGWQATGNEEFARVARETLDYVLREMTDAGGGFYSTQDADSEGEEGKFFVWTPGQVEEVLGEDAEAFCSYYDVTAGGNFEHGTSILNVRYDLDVAAYKLDMETAALAELLERGRRKLFEAREHRVKPGRDEKILAAWNGITLASMAHGYGAFGDPRYLAGARANADFLLTAMRRPDGRLFHSWKDGVPAGLGFSDDYAGVIAGLLALFQVDFDDRWLAAAGELSELVLERFRDPEDAALYLSDPDVDDLLTRPKEFEDGATPSGNNLFLGCLIQLARLTGKDHYRKLAEQGVDRLASLAGRLPTGFGVLLAAADLLVGPNQEIVLAGDSPELLQAAYSTFLPGRLVVSTRAAGVDQELVEGRGPVEDRPAAYVCEGHTCRLPVTTPEALRELLA